MPSLSFTSPVPPSLNTKISTTTNSNGTTHPTPSTSSPSSLSPLSTWLLQFHPYLHRLRQTVMHTIQIESKSSTFSSSSSSSSSSPSFIRTWFTSLQTHPTLMSLSRQLGVPSWVLLLTLFSVSVRMLYKAPRVWFMFHLLPWKSVDSFFTSTTTTDTELTSSPSSSSIFALKSFALTACVSHWFVHPKRWSTWLFWLSWWYLSKQNRNTTWIEWQSKFTHFLWNQIHTLSPFLFLDFNSTSSLSVESNSKQTWITPLSQQHQQPSSLGKEKKQAYERTLKPTSLSSNSFQADLFELEARFGEQREDNEETSIQLDQQKQPKRLPMSQVGKN